MTGRRFYRHQRKRADAVLEWVPPRCLDCKQVLRDPKYLRCWGCQNNPKPKPVEAES